MVFKSTYLTILVKILQCLMTIGFTGDINKKIVSIGKSDYKVLTMVINNDSEECEEVEF